MPDETEAVLENMVKTIVAKGTRESCSFSTKYRSL